jgi:hypothetical protein
MRQLFLCSHGLTSRFAHNLLRWFDAPLPRGAFFHVEATKLILPQASFSRLTGRFTAPTIEKVVISLFIDGLASGIAAEFSGSRI